MAFGTTATTPSPKTGLEWKQSIPIPLSGATSVPAGATNEYFFAQTDRKIRMRQIGIYTQQTVVSGVPSTNHMRLEIWKYEPGTTIATIMVKATITGPSSGTLLQRGVHVNVGTLNQFQSSALAIATAETILAAKFIGTNTLSRGLIGPVLSVRADVID